MAGVGTRLRAARDRQNLTRDDVASCTRIPASVLEHIEHNAFDRLPPAVFTKGHLRAYAATVGLDADEIVREYLVQWPSATQQLPLFREPAIEAHTDLRGLVTAILGIAAMLFAYSMLRQPGGPTPADPAVQAATLVAAPIVTGDVADPALQAAVPVEAGIRLEVQPTAECWVSAVADGELVIHRLLQKGERASVAAARELVVRIGDAAAFAYTLNGVPGRSLGDTGVPITVTITEQNYRTFAEDGEPQPPLSDATAV